MLKHVFQSRDKYRAAFTLKTIWVFREATPCAFFRLVFLFGLVPSLLCVLSEHHSFLLLDPALGCGLHGLAPFTPPETQLCTVLCPQLKAEGMGSAEALLVELHQPHLLHQIILLTGKNLFNNKLGKGAPFILSDSLNG